jgi:hypothetical protein
MDTPATDKVLKINRWLPYWAVFQTDLRQVVGNWVYRSWVIAMTLAAFGYLSYHLGVHEEAGIIQKAAAVMHDLLRWVVLGGCMLMLLMPVFLPYAALVNAAFSPVGRDFAAKTADFLFTTFVDIEGGHPHIADMEARAHAVGREVGVYTTCHVVCRPTQAEAEDYYEHYAVRMEDTASVDFYMDAKERFSSSHEPEAYRLYRTFLAT